MTVPKEGCHLYLFFLRILGRGVTVTQMTLDHLFPVRIQASQFYSFQYPAPRRQAGIGECRGLHFSGKIRMCYNPYSVRIYRKKIKKDWQVK